MAKIQWKPGTMVYPLPAVMVSCGSTSEEHNIITIAWTGTICTDPPMCYISIRENRHSYDIIKKNMEFVINLTTEKIAVPTDWCGVRSGKDYNKFEEMSLKKEEASIVKAPMIAESPVNIECKVTEIKKLGTHDMFLAEVVAINVDEKYVNEGTNTLDLAKAKPIAYLHGFYYAIGKRIGRFGFSVKKNKHKREIAIKKNNKNKE